jgi:hypothetical protein
LKDKLLLIDTIADITLVKESLVHSTIPVSIQYVTSVEEATAMVNTKKPDLLIVGASHVLQGGFEPFFTLGSFPIVVLCESIGLNRFLKDSPSNLCFIVRPLELDGIPGMIEKAYEFMLSCKEI